MISEAYSLKYKIQNVFPKVIYKKKFANTESGKSNRFVRIIRIRNEIYFAS
jgi:hypothetical protein